MSRIKFANTGTEFIQVTNNGQNAQTIVAHDYLDSPDCAMYVAPGIVKNMGTFPKHEFNDANGFVHLTVGDIADIECYLFRKGNPKSITKLI